MPSLLPGYEYDIFISYRQNDNRSGWVTEFVSHLQVELASTIKDPVSVYFDTNPHDGLLETHNVDKSLESKLKCLIFIPILSQTYCDSKSFAWEHEFCAFNKIALADSFGRDIRLSNGNVASRILPVKIHDLDASDKITIETEIGGPLRGIELIYKEPGVNRPLKPTDSRNENQNKTDYRNQVNKLANAVKEIVQAMQNPAPASTDQRHLDREPAANSRSRPWLIGSAFMLILLIVVAIYWWPVRNPVAKEAQPGISKSLVVLPFEDLSPSKDQEWFSDGLTEELLNRLVDIQELKLVSRTTAFSFKGKQFSARQIADTLGVAYVLEGSVRKANDEFRITVQLIKAADDSHVWSHTYDYRIDSIFKVQDDIARNITATLDILLDEDSKQNMASTGTSSIEAYEEYLKGVALAHKAHVTGPLNLLVEANKNFERAIAIDKGFADAYYQHADPYTHSVIGADEIIFATKMSEQQKFDRMSSDFSSAIFYTKSPARKASYEYARFYLSPDWSMIRAHYEKNKTTLRTGWQELLILMDPQESARRNMEAIQRDPFNELARAWAALPLIAMNLPDSALRLYDQSLTNGLLNRILKSVIYMRTGDYDRSFTVLEDTEKSRYTFLSRQLLAGRYSNTRRELDAFLRSKGFMINSIGESPIEIYNILGEYDKADSVAAINDRRMLGSCSLVGSILYFGLTFHLSSTPNLTARLIELGFDPEEFEKRHYHRYPVVKLKP